MEIICITVRHFSHYTRMFSVHMWGCNWILFMHGWFCPIRLIHLIGWKSLHFEKKLDFLYWPHHLPSKLGSTYLSIRNTKVRKKEIFSNRSKYFNNNWKTKTISQSIEGSKGAGVSFVHTSLLYQISFISMHCLAKVFLNHRLAHPCQEMAHPLWEILEPLLHRSFVYGRSQNTVLLASTQATIKGTVQYSTRVVSSQANQVSQHSVTDQRAVRSTHSA